jgi:hypothetical protein
MDVRNLPEVIDNPTALVALEEGGFDAARKVLAKADPSIDNRFYAHINSMIDRLNEVPRDELIEAGEDPAKVQALERLRSTVDDVLKNILALRK